MPDAKFNVLNEIEILKNFTPTRAIPPVGSRKMKSSRFMTRAADSRSSRWRFGRRTRVRGSLRAHAPPPQTQRAPDKVPEPVPIMGHASQIWKNLGNVSLAFPYIESYSAKRTKRM